MHKKDIKILSTCLFNQTLIRAVIITEEWRVLCFFFNIPAVKDHYLQKKNSMVEMLKAW